MKYTSGRVSDDGNRMISGDWHSIEDEDSLNDLNMTISVGQKDYTVIFDVDYFYEESEDESTNYHHSSCGVNPDTIVLKSAIDEDTGDDVKDKKTLQKIKDAIRDYLDENTDAFENDIIEKVNSI